MVDLPVIRKAKDVVLAGAKFGIDARRLWPLWKQVARMEKQGCKSLSGGEQVEETNRKDSGEGQMEEIIEEEATEVNIEEMSEAEIEEMSKSQEKQA